jgi:hypothetical protein
VEQVRQGKEITVALVGKTQAALAAAVLEAQVIFRRLMARGVKAVLEQHPVLQDHLFNTPVVVVALLMFPEVN